jgi:AraC-like DNA-binding protein
MESPWQIGRHVHSDYHELYLVVYGRIETRMEGRCFSGGRGEWTIIPAGSAHSNHVQEGGLRLGMVRWVGGEHLIESAPGNYRFDNAGRLGYLFDWMYERNDPTDARQLDQVEAILRLLLCETRRLLHADPTSLVHQVRSYVRRNVDRTIRLEDLAEEACLSKYHFLRKFRDQAGLTPMRFVTQVRMEVARNLIRHSQLSLEAIAVQAGFAGESHMHQVFRKHLGQSPGSLRTD